MPKKLPGAPVEGAPDTDPNPLRRTGGLDTKYVTYHSEERNGLVVNDYQGYVGEFAGDAYELSPATPMSAAEPHHRQATHSPIKIHDPAPGKVGA